MTGHLTIFLLCSFHLPFVKRFGSLRELVYPTLMVTEKSNSALLWLSFKSKNKSLMAVVKLLSLSESPFPHLQSQDRIFTLQGVVAKIKRN